MSTKISLQLETKHDLELLEKNIDCRIIRIYCTVMFRTASGASQPYKAIVDTGSPVSLIPKFIWKSIKFDVLSNIEFAVSGISPEGFPPLSAKIANVRFLLIGPGNFSPQLFTVKAYLLPTDHIPLLLGFEDILTSCALFCDYKNNTAYLEF